VTDADLSNAPDGRPTPSPGTAAPPEHFQPPPLRILHLLIWTAVAAALFKANMDTAYHPIHRQIRDVGNIIILAGGIVGFTVLVRSMFRGLNGRLQPGHWLLIVAVPVMVINTIGSRVLMTNESERWTLLAQWCVVWLTGVYCVALYSVAMWRTKDGWRWNVLFMFLVLLALAKVVELVLVNIWIDMVFEIANYSIVCLGLLAVVLADLRVRRDWLHWLGMAVLGVGPAANIASLVFALLIRI
jgi:limonene-1,2-epoxide hydrolase